MGATTRVTLIHGRVTVRDAHRPKGPLSFAPRGSSDLRTFVLVPGQQLVTTPTGPPRIEVASLDRVNAWENGQLVFDDENLASVAERVSRYSVHPVKVEGRAALQKISGVFNTGDVSTFVDTVSHYLPVEALDEPDGSTILRRKADR
jgi:transmembrane sensor